MEQSPSFFTKRGSCIIDARTRYRPAALRLRNTGLLYYRDPASFPYPEPNETCLQLCILTLFNIHGGSKLYINALVTIDGVRIGE
jgi:hypothetical protein